MRDLTFTLYDTVRSNQGTPETLSWDGWCQIFQERAIRPYKDGPAVVFGDIPNRKNRCRSNVRAAHAIGIDIDKGVASVALQALEPFEYFIWTTHNHKPSQPRLRIVVPFSEPIEPSEYALVWAGLNSLIKDLNDPQTKDISRLNYLPSCPAEFEKHAMSRAHSGKTMRVTDLEIQSIQEIDPAAARRLLLKIHSRMNALPTASPLKSLVKALVSGAPLAESGGRHEAIIDITWWLARKERGISALALADLFGSSLASMREISPHDSPTIEEVVDAYEGAIRKIDDAKAKLTEHREEDYKRRSGIVSYDDEDLARIASVNEWDPNELRDRWIIQYQNAYWIMDEQGQYRGPYGKDDASITSFKILARAPVRLVEITRSGVKYRPLADVVRESGQCADHVISDMVAKRTTFDPDERILHEAVRPLRDLEPKFYPEMDLWLKSLAGSQYSRLVDWLSCVPDLSKLLCAVYFAGPHSSGKTLLATGLAKLWTSGPPAEIKLVLSDFNDEIARCPMILADEEIPRANRETTVTTALRAMLSTMQRTLKRKFKPPTELHGAVRLILAANNEFLLDSGGVSSTQDLNAIAQRFLYIDVPQEAADMLNKMSRDERQYWARIGIAQHTLWLHNNHVVEEPGTRFWVEGDMSQMHRLLMLGSRWNALVAEWLTRYLMQPSMYDRSDTGLIRRGNGELLVNDQAIIDGWALYIKNTRIEPETSKISAALRSLSVSSKRRQLRNKNVRTRYRKIEVEHLLAWSDKSNIGDRRAILLAIGDTSGVSDDGPFEDFGTVPSVNDKNTPF